MRRLAIGLAFAGTLLGSAVPARAQATTQGAVSLDRIVARIGDDVVQSLDVRQARVLKFFGPQATTDDAVLDRLIDRRLEIADAARYQLPNPSDADVATRRGQWVAAIGNPSATDLAALLRDAGMTEQGLSAWFRDDLRVEALTSQRFSSAPATNEEVVTYIREHAADFTPAGQPDVQDAANQARARQAIAAAKHTTAVAAWLDTLRKRAQIIR
jgi:hypothetical protein